MAGYTPFGLTQRDLMRAKLIAEAAASGAENEDRTYEAIVDAMAALVKDRDDVFRVLMADEMGDDVPDDIDAKVVELAREIRAESKAAEAAAPKGLPIL